MNKKVVVLGGGAAGFFAAIAVKENFPEAEVKIVEKSDKILSKVKISGGGRCNVTHACFKISELQKNYPRGAKFLKKAFQTFSTKDTVEWFNKNGVELKTEADNRMFPLSNSSQTIVDVLFNKSVDLGVELIQKCAVEAIEKQEDTYFIQTKNQTFNADYLIVASGGGSKLSAFEFLAPLNIPIVPPVPSLFTFNVPHHPLKELMGLSVPKAIVKITGEKLQEEGPLLITHWGFSGPAILKTSAFGAKILAEKNYDFEFAINWLGILNENEISAIFAKSQQAFAKKQMMNHCPFDIPKRLWTYLLELANIPLNHLYADLGKKQRHKLIQVLTHDVYSAKGKTTFKEEFVTCGGIDLKAVNPNTMESTQHPNLFFAGEALNVDGVTGGFNFQAAWTTASIAGKLASKK